MLKYLLRLRGKKGFTLIELIVVLVILAVLAAAAVPAMAGDDGVRAKGADVGSFG